MRYGYWLPVFGGWLRNIQDEGMEASWNYVSRLARRSEEIGYDLTLALGRGKAAISGICRLFYFEGMAK
jgi:FMNH2-dependent dimethyl sulfone monooxygenase